MKNQILGSRIKDVEFVFITVQAIVISTKEPQVQNVGHCITKGAQLISEVTVHNGKLLGNKF
jgi:hypothetical protein